MDFYLFVFPSEDLIKSENIIIFTASSITDSDIGDFIKSGAKGILKKTSVSG